MRSQISFENWSVLRSKFFEKIWKKHLLLFLKTGKLNYWRKVSLKGICLALPDYLMSFEFKNLEGLPKRNVHLS